MAGVAPLLYCFALAQRAADPAILSLPSIVQRMEESQSTARAQTPYQVIREYSLLGLKSSSADAEVVAQLDFTPAASKAFSIQNWSGSTRGRQIVQRILEHETEASKGNHARTAITRDNYDFALIGDNSFEGRPCYGIGVEAQEERAGLNFRVSLG
jgi:hypothetical protein